jgi:hypothetical protein
VPDFDHDEQLLINAFAGFRDEVSTHVKPAGTAAARATVRHRNRVRTTAAGGLAALAVAVPAVAYAASGGESNGPPVVPGDSPTVVATTTSAPAAPTSAASTGTTVAAPDGRIAKADLNNATINVPAWVEEYSGLCPHGKIKFSGGKNGDQGAMQLEGDPVYLDVDHDGAQETVILLSCNPQGADYQVLALDRDTAGKIVTLGKVVGSAGMPGDQGKDIETIWGIEAGQDGQVRVDVGEFRPCCGTVQASQHQWRTYGWNGTAFTQTAGPTTFGPNPKVTDLTVTAEKLTMTATGSGAWEGTFTVTVHNNASFATPGKVEVLAQFGSSMKTVSVGTCSDPEQASCLIGTLPAGGSKTVTVKVHADSRPQPTASGTVYAYAVTDGNGTYPSRHDTQGLAVEIVTA